MKQLSTLLLLLILSLGSFAYSGKLSVASSSRAMQIKVMVDGKNYQAHNGHAGDIVINNLRTGYHNVKIYKRQAYNNGRGGRHGQYNMQLIYSSQVFVRNGYHTDILINRWGRAFVDERRMNVYENEEDYYENDHDESYDWNYSNNQAMSNERFEQLKQTLQSERFDDNKLQLLKTALKDNPVSSSQVAQLLALLSFENGKLDAAKYCYPFTTDTENYYLVANSFNFSSSKTALMQFIERNRGKE